MQAEFKIRIAALFTALLFALPGLAQTVDFDVLIDTDGNTASGCSVTPTNGSTLPGFEQRLRASVDLATFQVISLDQSSCAGGNFGAPFSIAGFSTPYPLALNTGVGGADAVELAVAGTALGAANLSQLRLTFVADNGTGSDVLATTNGGGPIVSGLPVQIPALSVFGLGALVLVLVGLAWLAHRRMGRVGALMAVMLIATAAWAMTFALDGDLGDWGAHGPDATDPSGDPTDGADAIDLLAGFVALEGGDLFFRMDVSDTENQARGTLGGAFSTDEDTPLSVPAPGVRADDSDGNSDPITAVLETRAAYTQSFTPTTDGSLDLLFADGFETEIPSANAQAVTTDEDLPVIISLTGSDVDGDPLTFAIGTGPANGSLGPITQINPTTAEVVYTPNADFNGADSFTFTVNDGTDTSPAATISLTVNPVNDPPAADAGAASTDEDTPLTVTLTGSDIDGDPLTFVIGTGPADGSLGPITQINPTTAEVVYTPNGDFNGADSFTFTVNDGTDTSPAATISLTVNPVNDPPAADAGAASTDEDTPLTVTLTGSDIDGDPLTFAIGTGPADGSLGPITQINPTTAEVVYTPNADFNGADSFTFTVDDGTDTSPAATITLTVNPVNDRPEAGAGTAVTDENTPVTITLTGSDADGDALTFTIATPPGGGSLGPIAQLTPTIAEVTYTSNADFNGADSFTFTVNDGSVDSASATITLTVNPINDRPEADAGAASTDEDTPVVITLAGSDVDGDALTFAIATPPGSGSLGVIAQLTPTTAEVTYTPNADFNGGDGFTFTTNDGAIESTPATISLTVNPVNDPPTADAGAASTDEDTGVTVTLTGNDVEGDPLTFAIASPPPNGSLGAINQINPTTAEVVYTPNADFNGADSFTFTVNDGSVDSASATITLTVNPINDRPEADAGAASTDEDTPVVITLAGSDVDGDALTFAIATPPGSGSLGVIAQLTPTTAEVTYTPNADFNGGDGFTFTTNDGAIESTPATISLTVNPVNDPPEADAGAASTDEDTPVTITLTGSDVEGSALTFAIGTGPANGSLGPITQINPTTAEVVYTPNADFNGADSFTFTVNDGTVDSAAATISLTVNPVNDPPEADAGAASTDEDTPVTITLTGSDVEGSALTFAIGTSPANGSLGAITPVNATTADVVYTPNADFNGADSFTFTVNDGSVDSAAATISLTVNAVNDPPEADAGAASTDEDTPVTITLTGSDVEGDPLTFAIASPPANGSLGAITPVNATTAEVVYTPNADFNGADSFTFTVNDGSVDSAAATISLTVNPANDPPTADAGAAGTDEDAPVTITLTGSDVDGDPLTFAIASPSGSGSLGAITPIDATSAQVTYTPNPNFNGADSFTFTVNDGTVDSASATISLTVNPVNDPPTANPGMATTVEDTPVTITLTGGDVEGSALTFAIASPPASGGLGAITPINATTAEVVYTPNTAFVGNDSFTFTANDGTAISSAATISITVTPGNDPPVANDAMTATDEDTPVVITLTGSDADGDPLTFAIVGGPSSGSLGAITQVTPASASVTYTPNANFFGADSFTFTVNDGTDTSTAATVSLTVDAVNDPPTVVAHTLTTHSAIRITLGAADSELLKDGAADVDDPAGALSVSALAATSANGAALTLIDPATGTYRYDPPGGFTGPDSFTYEVCDGATSASPVQCAIETVNVTVTGPPLWFVDPAAASGDGSLNSPFQSLSQLPGSRATGGRIFLFAGTNISGHGFAANEHLIGQGATGNSFDGFLGVQVPANGTLDARPAVAGTRPVVSGQVTLAGGAIARGFNISTSGPTGLFGSGAFTGIDVQEMNVTNINGTAISLTGLSGEFTLGAVNASGGVNGIVLDNFGASGFFLVNGDGTNARNGSGGTIQNTTGDGVLLTGASNVTLASMRLINVGDNTDPSAGGNNLAGNDHAIQSSGGGDVVLSGVLIDSPAAGGWEAVDLGGVNRIDNNSRIANVNASNMQALEVRNTNTDMTSFTIDASEFANQAATNGSSYVLFQGFGSSVMNIIVGNNSLFEQLFGNGLQANGVDTATVTLTVQNSTLRDAVDGTGLGSTGGLGGIVVAASQNSTVNYGISDNSLNDLGRPLANAGIVTIQGIGGTGKSLNGNFDRNNIDRIGYPTAATATGMSMVGHRVIDVVTENNIVFLDHESDSNFIDDTSREAFFVSSRDDSQDFDISITNNDLGQTVPIGSTNREAIEILSEDASVMEIEIMNNAVAGNTSALDQVVDIDTENTSFMDIHFIGNTVTNAQAAGGFEVVVDTENGTSTHCMVFSGNTATDVEFDVNASPSGHRIEEFASIGANNPGVTNFIDGAGVTDVAANTCQLPDF